MILDIAAISSFLGAFLTTISFIPQAIKTIRTRNTTSISLLMYILFTLGVTFFGIFAFTIKIWPVMIGNIITLIFCVIILTIKISNVTKGVDNDGK